MRPRADTLLVWTGGECTYGCSTCPIPKESPSGVSPEEIQQTIAQGFEEDRRLVVLAGGEPLLRRDVLRLVAAVRASGHVPGIVTTGRGLSYPQLREKLRRLGLAYLRVQFFGFATTHDTAVVLPDAFEQAMAGLRAWSAESDGTCDVDVALTWRGRPLDGIEIEVEALGNAIAGLNAQLVVAVSPQAYADPSSAELLARSVVRLKDWSDKPNRPLLVWEGLPTSVAATKLPIHAVRPAFVVRSPRACCLGTTDEMLNGTARAVEAVCANSFNYVRTATTVPWHAEAPGCAACDSAGGLEIERHLWLVEGERLVLYATDTGDFDATEIKRIKDEWCHVFVDRAPAGKLDDFIEGMRRVLPDATCTGCENRGRCGRRFLSVDGPPYAREEAWIAEYVASLRGRVLDVGCGEQLYRDELAPLLRSGVVQYTGLDPDEASLAGLREIFPRGRFYLGGIEEFRDVPASYDHILCLRSLNHVVDVDEAMGRMAQLLRPGGSLLMVECTPFAMLRSAEQVAAADRAPRAGHQHLRNMASEEVLPFARRHALRVVEHQPASLRSTNEWILLLERVKTVGGGDNLNAVERRDKAAPG